MSVFDVMVLSVVQKEGSQPDVHVVVDVVISVTDLPFNFLTESCDLIYWPRNWGPRQRAKTVSFEALFFHPSNPIPPSKFSFRDMWRPS